MGISNYQERRRVKARLRRKARRAAAAVAATTATTAAVTPDLPGDRQSRENETGHKEAMADLKSAGPEIEVRSKSIRLTYVITNKGAGPSG